MTPSDKARLLAGDVRRARVLARQARGRAILTWWPLSWALHAWAALQGWRADHLEARARGQRAAVLAEVERLDARHRPGRRTAHRSAPGSR